MPTPGHSSYFGVNSCNCRLKCFAAYWTSWHPANNAQMFIGYLDIIVPAPNSAIPSHNKTLYSSQELVFQSCEPICEIGENLHLGKIPYGGKVWWVESLVNLANRLWFPKLKPSKVVVTINNPLNDPFIHQTFSAKCMKRVNFPNILPTKLSRYIIQYSYKQMYWLCYTSDIVYHSLIHAHMSNICVCTLIPKLINGVHYKAGIRQSFSRQKFLMGIRQNFPPNIHTIQYLAHISCSKNCSLSLN